MGRDRSFSYSSGERKPEKQASKRVVMPKPHNQLTDQAVDFWLARGAVLVIVGLQISHRERPDDRAALARAHPGVRAAHSAVDRDCVDATARAQGIDKRANDTGLARQIDGPPARNYPDGCRYADELRRACAPDRGDPGRARRQRPNAAPRCAQHLGHQRHHLRVVVLGAGSWRPAGAFGAKRGNDFLFTQQQTGEPARFPNWSPGFIDYLFLAFTNATAFSPADTFPLTVRAKLLMMAESGISLVTIALVASRAVGILN